MTSAVHPRTPSAARRWRRCAGATVAAAAAIVLVALPAGAQSVPGGFLFAGGELTGVAGSTLQLDGPAGSNKVIVTSKTKYRRTEATDASSITKGACVRVTGTGDAADGIAATAVAIQESSDTCTRAGRGFPGRPSGRGNGSSDGNVPTPPGGQGFPNGGTLPNGGSLPDGGTPPNGGGFMGGGVNGKVTSVRDDSIVVTSRVPFGQSSGSNGSGSAPRLKKQKVEVTFGSDVTVTHPVTASRSDLVTGVCVTAQGKTDSVGTVTATDVLISQPTDGACGFGGFGGLGTGPGAPADSSSS